MKKKLFPPFLKGGSGRIKAESTDPETAQLSQKERGKAGEDLAAAYLNKQGYKILERNYRTPLGEIDLIARHRGLLVFVEVKTRSGTRFGAGQDAVHHAKQARLRKLADYYLKQKRLGEVAVRFDVVAILLAGSGAKIEIIQNAFGN
jgi:putative endonuclease